MIEMSSGSLPLTVAFVVASVVALLAATAAAVTDVATRRLPNRLVGVTALGSVVASATVDVVSWWRAGVVVVAVFAGPLLVVRLVAPATIGGGDVKLAAALAPLLIGGGAFAGSLALCVASGSAATWGLLRRRSSIAFGPALVFGTAVVVVVARGTS